MPDVVVLRLRDMLSSQRGPLARRLAHAVISIALRLFFRRIERSDGAHVPLDGPVVFVLNHPNGLIDPGLVFCALPRRISFLAKSTLFRLPLLGWLLRTVEALPLYRRSDVGADVARNRLTFAACRELLSRGRCIALFPEGRSHHAPQLEPVKTGAARITLGALSYTDPARPDRALTHLPIIPVGLYYTTKTPFRGEALIHFGAPLRVTPVPLDADGEPPREAVRELSQQIETALRAVTLNVGSDAELEVIARVEQLFSSLYLSSSLRQPLAAELELRRRFAVELDPQRTPARRHVAKLRHRVLRHESELARLGLRPDSLAVLAHTRWYVLRRFLLRGFVLLMLAPLTLVGATLHLPAYLLAVLLARLFPTHGVDEIAPTVKILAAIMFMPLTWLVCAGLAYFWWGWRVALGVFPVVIVCGYVALRSLEELYDLRGWFKAALVLVRDRRRLLRLLLERRSLHREIERLLGSQQA